MVAAEQQPVVPEAARERSTTPVELLWDLVFVFAITQVIALLSSKLTAAGLGRSALVLALIWWAWSAFVWVSNAHDPDSASARGVLLLATVLVFICGLALPRAFGREGTLFAVTYAGVRFLHLGLYIDAARRGRASLSAILGFTTTVCIGMALLVAGSFLGGSARALAWTVAAAIDYAGPAWLTRDRLRALQRVAVSHFTERYSLFIIICLGESIVAVGLAASRRALDAELLAAVALALLTTIGLWWAYFDRFAATAEDRLREHPDPVLAAADAYSYMHLLLVAGIIAFAVGAKFATADVSVPLAHGARLALCGGVALYLVGHVAFLFRLTGTIAYAKLCAAGVCLLVYALSGGMPAWAVSAAVVVVLALLVVAERVLARPLAAVPRGCG